MAPTVKQLLQEAKQQLADYVEDAYTDSQVLLGYCLQRDRAWLIGHADDPLADHIVERFRQLLAARCAGQPVAHLLGSREFWSMQFRVTADTLIPRPETEHLIEYTLQLPLDENANVLDYGTGSGVVAIVLATQRPGWDVTAIECSSSALAVAKENAASHQAEINFMQACDLSLVPPHSLDLLVSNPPYVAAGDAHLQQGDVRFEPTMALVAGEDGLDCIRMLVADAHRCLKPSGYLVMEHGFDQGSRVRELLAGAGYGNITTIKDLAGHDRLTAGQTPTI